MLRKKVRRACCFNLPRVEKRRLLGFLDIDFPIQAAAGPRPEEDGKKLAFVA